MTNTHSQPKHRSPIAWNELKTILDRHQRFVLTSHVRADCDALGSELAMAEVLEYLGKTVRIVNADAVPPRLAFVDPQNRIEVLPDDLPADLGKAVLGSPVDVIMVLDTAAWGQLGRMADVIRGTSAQVIVIDHHANDGELDAVMFKDVQAEATGRLIADLVDFLEIPWNPRMATALFLAIATDTGWFRFSSTKSSTYEVAGQLIDAGACPQEIYRQLYERDSLSRAKLRGLVLSRLAVECDGRVAHTYVLDEDFSQTGALRSETEDFINMALALEGTQVAAMFTEHPAGSVKISLRSRDGAVDCSRITALFGGGGHKAAAGATLAGDVVSVRTQVLGELRSALQA
ncbi:MAG: DHH family phosphoesterase [Pirellulaceae bacterium]